MRHRVYGPVGLGWTLVIFTMACGGGSDGVVEPPPPPSPEVSITVAPLSASLDALQDTVRLAATVQNGGGAAVTWNSQSPNVASVAGGLVTALANGTAVITATVAGKVATATVMVQQVASAIVVTPESGAILVGGTVQLAGQVMDRKANVMSGAAVTWTAIDPAIASVSTLGLVTGLAAGPARIEGSAGAARDTVTVTVALAPSTFANDTTLSGTVVTGPLTIPAGVVVTLNGPVTIQAAGDVSVAGTITGNCTSLTIDAAGALAVTGTVRNPCVLAAPEVAPLQLIGRTGYELDGATVESSGEVRLTTDPSLEDADFEPAAPATRRSRIGGSRRATAARLTSSRPAAGLAADGNVVCNLRGNALSAKPEKAANGFTGIIGQDGTSAKPWTAECGGALRFLGDNVFTAQHGGDGGDGINSATSGVANALGGEGGAGGLIRLRATGTVRFEGNGNVIRGGNGGRGGDADASSGANQAGPQAPTATASAGKGGDAGLIAIHAVESVDFATPTTIQVGNGGRGGNAAALGETGAPAAGASTPAQAGGQAIAWGGDGGESPPKQLTAQNLVVLNPGNLILTGGAGGRGGDASAIGGMGGTGIPERPEGGHGGKSEVHGGNGGDALLLDLTGTPFAPGGAGGDGFLFGGQGANGLARCSLPLGMLPGGAGGDGGPLVGLDGTGGLGLVNGANGTLTTQNAGRGGNGGHGEPRGLGGAGGTKTFLSPPVSIGLNGVQGQPGFDCIGGFGDFNSVTTGSLSSDPCPALAFTHQISNFSMSQVQFQVTEPIPFFGPATTSGFLATAPGPTTEWATTLIPFNADRCLMKNSGPVVEGVVTYTFTLGPTTVIKTFSVKYTFNP